MKNRTHYVPYQSQDAKNVENTPILLLKMSKQLNLQAVTQAALS